MGAPPNSKNYPTRLKDRAAGKLRPALPENGK